MKRTLRQLTFGLMVLAAIFAAPAQAVRGAGPRQVQHRARLDTNLLALVDRAATENRSASSFASVPAAGRRFEAA